MKDIKACVAAVRAAQPDNLVDAKSLARQQLELQGVAAPNEADVNNIAELALSPSPARTGLKILSRGYIEIFKILKSASVPSWLDPPRSALPITSKADGELFVYPVINLEIAFPIFDRIMADLSERLDTFDTLGTIKDRSFPAWLSMGTDASEEVLVHVGRTTVGYLNSVDKSYLRAGTGRLLPSVGQQLYVDAYLIDTPNDDKRFALWFPYS